jgi:SAM-dependent methyltransferase
VSVSAVENGRTFAPAMESAKNYTRWVLQQFEGSFGRNVLEVGIGHGGYGDHVPATSSYCGLDIDPQNVAEARGRYPSRSFIEGDVVSEDFVERLRTKGFDTVLCCNVLEHIDDDRRAVQNMLRVLIPGGRLLLLVPALPSLFNDLDRIAGHRRRYTKRTLSGIVDPALGRVKRLAYFNSVGALGWFANSLVRHKNIESRSIALQVALFDRLMVPVSRAADRLVARRLGQSLVAIVEKL